MDRSRPHGGGRTIGIVTLGSRVEHVRVVVRRRGVGVGHWHGVVIGRGVGDGLQGMVIAPSRVPAPLPRPPASAAGVTHMRRSHVIASSVTSRRVRVGRIVGLAMS
jgi:hypothetical protein